MRNRKMQRQMRRMHGKEEKIDLFDCCGIKDPTPYQAVKAIIEKQKIARAC